MAWLKTSSLRGADIVGLAAARSCHTGEVAAERPTVRVTGLASRNHLGGAPLDRRGRRKETWVPKTRHRLTTAAAGAGIATTAAGIAGGMLLFASPAAFAATAATTSGAGGTLSSAVLTPSSAVSLPSPIASVLPSLAVGSSPPSPSPTPTPTASTSPTPQPTTNASPSATRSTRPRTAATATHRSASGGATAPMLQPAALVGLGNPQQVSFPGALLPFLSPATPAPSAAALPGPVVAGAAAAPVQALPVQRPAHRTTTVTIDAATGHASGLPLDAVLAAVALIAAVGAADTRYALGARSARRRTP